MNQHMNIPSKFGFIKKEDVNEIVRRALKKTNPMYPVPAIWDETQCRRVVEML